MPGYDDPVREPAHLINLRSGSAHQRVQILAWQLDAVNAPRYVRSASILAPEQRSRPLTLPCNWALFNGASTRRTSFPLVPGISGIGTKDCPTHEQTALIALVAGLRRHPFRPATAFENGAFTNTPDLKPRSRLRIRPPWMQRRARAPSTLPRPPNADQRANRSAPDLTTPTGLQIAYHRP